MNRARGDDGQAGGAEAIPFGLLVFVVCVLLVANAWGVVDAKVATSTAAEEAGRAYVEGVRGPSAQLADAAAQDAARRAIAGYGRDPRRVVVAITPGGAVARCTRVTVEVSYDVPAISLPWIGGFGSAIAVHSRHSEIVDPFRNGVAGEADCV